MAEHTWAATPSEARRVADQLETYFPFPVLTHAAWLLRELADRVERAERVIDAAYTCAIYFQMRTRTDEQDWARAALDSTLRALGADPDAHPSDEGRIARALEAGRAALEKGDE